MFLYPAPNSKSTSCISYKNYIGIDSTFIFLVHQVVRHGDVKAKLTKGEEAGCGILGGALSCWNHPFEVARIEAQAAANAGEPSLGMVATMGKVILQVQF